MLHCPFCGAPESDRIEIEGRRFVVFPCVFTPELDASLSEEEAQRRLDETSPGGGGPYFRKMCDRLHLYVTAGAGGDRLTGRAGRPAQPASPDPAPSGPS
ncbi:MAG: hypothetical protein L3K18_06055 [Thermoplasmata archaeon]|nr:hypothetical protein [Thermoplasmata archaeon]MCI4356687.1 hypothetical protein [Thermoplasmata archaeon]